MRHHRSDVPCYQFWVDVRPRTKRTRQWRDAVADAAREEIDRPLTTEDVEIEIAYATRVGKSIRADIDNIIKPTLDALKGIAYADDAQVRSVTATLFDATRPAAITGRVEHVKDLLYSKNKHVTLISVFSDERLTEMGGEDAVREARLEDFLTRLTTRRVQTKAPSA